MKRKLFNLFIVGVMFVALVALVLFKSGFENMVHLIESMSYKYLLACFGCMAVYWLGDVLILHTITGYLNARQKLVHSFRAAMIGFFFNAITPFASGGQPMQAVAMVKDGVKPGHSASILIVKSVTYQLMIVLYSLVVIIFKTPFFINRIPEFFFLYLVGFIVNLFVVIMYVLFIYKREQAKKIIMAIFRLVNRIKILRKFKKYESWLERELQTYSEGAAILKNNIHMLITTLFIQFVKLTFFFSVPYFIYLGINKASTADYVNMVAAMSVVKMIASYVPLPGASGGSEGFGAMFLKLFFGGGPILGPVVLVWRVFTYYLSLIFGGLFYLLTPSRKFISENQEV